MLSQMQRQLKSHKMIQERLGFQAYNFGGSAFGAGSIQNTLFPERCLLTKGMSKLSFEPQFPGFDRKNLGRTGVGGNRIDVYNPMVRVSGGTSGTSLAL